MSIPENERQKKTLSAQKSAVFPRTTFCSAEFSHIFLPGRGAPLSFSAKVRYTESK